jgi:hypothetical protein
VWPGWVARLTRKRSQGPSRNGAQVNFGTRVGVITGTGITAMTGAVGLGDRRRLVGLGDRRRLVGLGDRGLEGHRHPVDLGDRALGDRRHPVDLGDRPKPWGPAQSNAPCRYRSAGRVFVTPICGADRRCVSPG